jgi:hypothetical protein
MMHETPILQMTKDADNITVKRLLLEPEIFTAHTPGPQAKRYAEVKMEPGTAGTSSHKTPPVRP